MVLLILNFEQGKMMKLFHYRAQSPAHHFSVADDESNSDITTSTSSDKVLLSFEDQDEIDAIQFNFLKF